MIPTYIMEQICSDVTCLGELFTIRTFAVLIPTYIMEYNYSDVICLGKLFYNSYTRGL